jgi:hypothetical protein
MTMPHRDYTYRARITSVSADRTGVWSGDKGEAREDGKLDVNVAYEGGSTDSFIVNGTHRDEFVIGRDVHVILRVLGTQETS